MAYLDENFLLYTETARRLFHEVAKERPIIDYHCHLSPREIATNHRWQDISEIWLGGDHYKWRVMRTNGISEELITGSASPREKFQAWAETVPSTIRNPIHHWSHLELQRYFGINTLLSPKTADEIWEKTNERLAQPDFCAHGILEKFRVEVVGTTDDPADPLDDHKEIAASGLKTKIFPTFRPDKVFNVDQPEAFRAWIEKLGATANRSIVHLSDLLSAIHQRHDDFHEAGCRLSDHGLERCPGIPCDDAEASIIFDKAMCGKPVSAEEKEKFCFFMLVFLGELDASKGWTKQLHLGAYRNVNPLMYKKLGPDTGYDVIGDPEQGRSLCAYLGALSASDSLPKVILYNLNPRDNYMFTTIIGAFQDGVTAGKIQFGSGWWFLDQKDGMELQLNALSMCGLLPRFVGMLTDSRSFLSYPRHEYFRRLLCSIIGTETERGELPDDFEMLSELIANICDNNARNYFGFSK
jgi:glucuronate isomerase